MPCYWAFKEKRNRGSCNLEISSTWELPVLQFTFPLLSNSMKGKEMGSNTWQYSVCKYVKKRGKKRHCNVPGGTQGCRPHTWWLHRKGRSFMEVVDGWGHARTSLDKACLEVVSAQQRRWDRRWNSLSSPFSPLTEKIKRCFSLQPFAFWNAGEEHVDIKQGLQKAKLGESWSSPSSSLWCKKYFKLSSQLMPGLGLWFAFTVVGPTHS